MTGDGAPGAGGARGAEDAGDGGGGERGGGPAAVILTFPERRLGRPPPPAPLRPGPDGGSGGLAMAGPPPGRAC